jgi:hypothetical protein
MGFLFSAYKLLRMLRTIVRVVKFVATGLSLGMAARRYAA